MTPGFPRRFFIGMVNMDLLHNTWFWVIIIAAPVATIIGTLARMSQKQPPLKLPPGVAPGTYAPAKPKADKDKATDGEKAKV